MAAFARGNKNIKAGATETVGTYPGSGEEDILIGLSIANLDVSDSASVDVKVVDRDGGPIDGTEIHLAHLCKGVSVPVGGSVELIQGKFVLAEDDVVIVTSTKEVDVWISWLDDATA